MQTYEVQPGQSMAALLDELTNLARTDREITLIVPAHAQVLQQVGNVSQLKHLVTTEEIHLRAAVADRVTLGLFRIMGLEAEDNPGGLTATAPPPPAAPATAPPAPAPPAPDAGEDDLANMNFDADELEQTLRVEGLQPNTPAPAEEFGGPARLAPPPPKGGSIFGRLRQMLTGGDEPSPAQPAPPDPAHDPAPSAEIFTRTPPETLGHIDLSATGRPTEPAPPALPEDISSGL